MLILSRKVKEKIFIGDDKSIIIEVLDIQAGKVRVGITAPNDVNIYREEVFYRTAKEGEGDPA